MLKIAKYLTLLRILIIIASVSYFIYNFYNGHTQMQVIFAFLVIPELFMFLITAIVSYFMLRKPKQLLLALIVEVVILLTFMFVASILIGFNYLALIIVLLSAVTYFVARRQGITQPS